MSVKQLALDDFINSNKHLPAQGSKEWLSSRSITIGGSEIATLLGLNPYQNLKKLISQKTGITTFTKSAPLWFGNIMESVLQNYTEQIFHTKIYETGSIQYNKSECLKYSPDGLAVVNKKYLTHIFNSDDIELKINNKSNFDNKNDDELLILFEFKNPFMRKPEPGIVPIYYKPQPEMGMHVIDICEVSIFIEGVFRFCSYNDIINLNNKYNTRYHFDKKKGPDGIYKNLQYKNNPLAYGAFTLYYSKDDISKNMIDIINLITEHINSFNIHEFDLSAIGNYKIINAIMENIIDHKNIKIEYHNLYLNDINSKNYYFKKYTNITNFKNEIKDKKNNIPENMIYLGCFCFKLFDININPIYKNELLTDSVLDLVHKVINIIKECNTKTLVKDKKLFINSLILSNLIP